MRPALLPTLLLSLLLTACAAGTASHPGEPPLESMVGAMIMCGFRGAELPPHSPFARALAAGRVGHVILFDWDVERREPRNILSREQLTRLTHALRAIARRPLFIAVDQEGGRVCRLKPAHGFTPLPSARVMGQGAPEATRALARASGAEMRAVGINVDFAPVADVAGDAPSAIGRLERSFGGDAGRVTQQASAFGLGLADAGVIPALKHFPGIGCGSGDTHLARVDIAACFDERRDLAPYAAALARGWPGMVMVGHVHTAMDTAHPASLSSAVVNGLLRQRMGWQGVVISDDMQMQAIRGHYPLEEAVRLAVEAGVDILLFGNNLHWQPDMAELAHATLLRLVREGRISRERVRASWQRIQHLLARVP